MAQALYAPWRERILSSLNKNKNLVYSKYMQIATVRPDGFPACRTVVFRGFLEDTDTITFVTDKRSRKVQEIAANSRGEICWYFPETREQYRIQGTLRVVDEWVQDDNLAQARQQAWQSMSDPGRSQFMWPMPGFPRLDEDKGAFDPPIPAAEAPAVSNFCLVLMDVLEVDLVELRGNQQRTLFRRSALSDGNTAWSEENVNP